MAIYEITVTDVPWQRLETYLSDTAVSIELWWNETSARWSMSLEIAGTLVLSGKRLVTGVNLLAPYEFGIGSFYVVDYEGLGGAPGRDSLPSGQFIICHDDGLPEAA